MMKSFETSTLTKTELPSEIYNPDVKITIMKGSISLKTIKSKKIYNILISMKVIPPTAKKKI
jgi:hypothetical protein